jgi:hypothetical protein
MNNFKKLINMSLLWFSMALPLANAQQPEAAAQRFLGKWQGSWLEGMASGKVFLDLAAAEGESKIEMTRLPKFGAGKALVREVLTEGQTLKFVTARADGEKVSFDLKLNEAGSRLKGTARYEGSRAEVELVRPEE